MVQTCLLHARTQVAFDSSQSAKGSFACGVSSRNYEQQFHKLKASLISSTAGPKTTKIFQNITETMLFPLIVGS